MRTIALALAFLVIPTVGQVVGDRESLPVKDGAEGREFTYWMDVKLQESQNIFAALASGDFAKIEQSADKLKAVSKLEGFVRRSAEGYRTQQRSFEFAVNEIAAQADAESLEGVALGFQQLTLSCLHCHKQIRRESQTPPTP